MTWAAKVDALQDDGDWKRVMALGHLSHTNDPISALREVMSALGKYLSIERGRIDSDTDLA